MPEIHFNFGTGSPIPEQDALKDIARSWQQAPVLPVPLSVFNGFSLDFRPTGKGRYLPLKPENMSFL